MKRYGPTDKDFKETYSKTIKNSLQFEKFCNKESFATENEESRLAIFIWDNELITTYLPSIIENADTIDIRDEKLSRRYHMNPQRLSMDYFGTTDYWYLILAMNNYTSRFYFKNFEDLLLFPNAQYIDSLITHIERERRL